MEGGWNSPRITFSGETSILFSIINVTYWATKVHFFIFVNKGENSRMKSVSIESSGGKKYVFGLRKFVYSQKNAINNNN